MPRNTELRQTSRGSGRGVAQPTWCDTTVWRPNLCSLLPLRRRFGGCKAGWFLCDVLRLLSVAMAVHIRSSSPASWPPR